MAVGRISGPLLKANLLRNGINLAFETDLLYLDVINGRVGIKTTSPTHDLTINGTTRTADLEVTTQADLASFTFLNNTLSSSSPTINLEPSGLNPVVYQAKILVNDNLQISTNAIETTVLDSDLEIRTNGTGQVNINSNVYVDGNIHATGTITADGDIVIGDANTDNIVFNADVASNIIPDQTNFYDLGSDPSTSGQEWRTAYINNILANTVTTTNISVSNIDLALTQGNIIYVSTNGNDLNSGVHEHDPFLTIEYALGQAVAGDTVYIYPGTYQEEFPLTIPAGVHVKGASIRSVIIEPTAGTIDHDAFFIDGEVTVEDLTVTGFRFNYIEDSGYGFRFKNNFSVTTRSPYIRNVSVITKGSTTSVSDPYGFDSNDAGKGAFFDGSVVDPSSNEASCLFDGVTFITPNQESVIATNGVRIEWINSFTYFADKGIYAYSSSEGFANQGLTRLKLSNKTGSWSSGDTLEYYSPDGITITATGTIDSIDGDYINLTGRCQNFETVSSRLSKIIYVNGDAAISSLQSKFGTSSLLLNGTGDFINVANHDDFKFGTDNFTVELWIYPTTSGTNRVLVDSRIAVDSETALTITIDSSDKLCYIVNNTNRITGTTSVAANTWHHIVYSRTAGVGKLFLNGTQEGSSYSDLNYYNTRPLRFGASYNRSSYFIGYIDEIRVTKQFSKYTTNFTSPSSALNGDLSTVLLVHFEGSEIVDDNIVTQDLRTLTGSASSIEFADYTDFGAEIRCVGSVSVYGNYGIYGDGVGVIVYLNSQNFSYVGAGKISTNDPTSRIDANEIVSLNDAQIYYTSTDNDGNFKAGDNFEISQASNTITFIDQVINVTSTNGIVINDGVSTTTITAQDITTGNLRIYDNNIDSLSGDITVTAASGNINLKNDTYITGNLDVTGNVTIGGNITIGDQTSDNINFVGSINSDLIPAQTATYDLGTALLRWNTAFLSRVEIDNLVIDSNTISTTSGNDDLNLIANGTGRIYIPESDVEIDQNLTVTGDLTVETGTSYLRSINVTGTITQTGSVVQTGNFTTSGTTEVTGNIIGTGYIQLPQIRIEGNTIQTTATNTDLNLIANGTGDVIIEGIQVADNNIQSIVTDSNIVLTPQGTGSVVVNSTQSLIIPVGTTLERPETPTNGMIRYNTTLSRYEGYNNGYWLQLSGVIDNSGNTRILAEATPGANDNILYFYANNVLTATIDSTKLHTIKLQTTQLDISEDTITTIAPNTNINITTTGTGGVIIGNLRVYNNTITNIVADAVTEFSETGEGYVKIAGTNGFVIPSGDTENDRPLYPELGMTRYNTVLEIVEVYDGVTWTNVAGASGGVTATEATEIGIAVVLALG